MKKIVTIVLVVMGLLMAGNSTQAQTGKLGYISLQELIPTMPEYKKADTIVGDAAFHSHLQYGHDLAAFRAENRYT